MGVFRLISLIPFVLLLARAAGEEAGDELSTFIIHVQTQAENHLFDTTDGGRKAWYQSFLPEDGRLVHAYHHVASGFAARLTRRELDAMSSMPEFVTAVPEMIYKLQTTHTPQFLGLDTALGGRNVSVGFGDGVIIGMLDSGVFPYHPSFSGDGMPPPPARWKGRCDFNGSVCNNKLIGAQDFTGANSSSPIDEAGHGTHTSSTAAGAVVPGAQVLNQGYGSASGIAPRAHIAMYKVCGGEACSSADILAGIDAALSDGCDVLSISLGGPSVPFYFDSMAVGTFAAAEKGLFVSMAAGNSGPNHTTLLNEAPWVLTVAASTMDRLFSAKVRLGNGLDFDGESVYQPNISTVSHFLVYAGDSSTPGAQFCGNGSLNGLDVKDKIVVCDLLGHVKSVTKGEEVLRAGGFGMILVSNEAFEGFTTLADAHVLPALHVGYEAGFAIKNYIKSAVNPFAQISFGGTVLGTSPAPAMSFFSSRGPSKQSPGILKPDITGPGVNVLAAWPFQVGPPAFDLRPTFNVISGTSMSTPHLSGIAALIKSKHPDWSPAMIKSAIMTTADVTDRYGVPILDEQRKVADFFAIGAGHVNPAKAVEPGLVYDISPSDYIGVLCGKYSSTEVSIIARTAVNCSAVSVIPESQLNYPSISFTFPPSSSGSMAPMSVERTVKIVGEAPALYTAHVDLPESVVSVSIYPRKTLLFTGGDQEQSFTVIVVPRISSYSGVVQGALRWVSDKHTVRSPISITFTGH